ncbi:MAG: DUF4469 domain-containing protein [Treponema sp.]|nr:DUF4469 domain-containing protein [Treponema sp.]
MANLYTDHGNKINVVIHQNQFSEDENSYYGKVTRNTVTLEQLIKGILDDNQNTNTGLNAYILNFAMDRMKARILSEIKAGNAVSLLDLGVMYLGLKGSFSMDAGNTDVSALRGKELTVGFTPSEDVQNAVSQLKVGSVSLCLKAPAMNKIVNLATKKENKVLSLGKGVELKGNRLKLTEGEGCGIFFVPVGADGSASSDEEAWIRVGEENIFKNYPRSLIFQVPPSMKAGKYAIAVRTLYCGGNNVLKAPVTGFSATVDVAA